jgi:DNA-binding transcriptional ArsR family regulator
MRGDIDVAAVGALIGEPARAAVLVALADGRALAATTLAAEAQVAPSTLSGHLNRLMDGGLIRVERSGRHRYFRLAGALGAALFDMLITRGWVRRGKRRVVHITGEGHLALSEQLQVDVAVLVS